MLIGGSIMIEIIYKNEDENLLKDDNIKLPKNIRQIGEGNSDYQIYVEDNVMNYLKKCLQTKMILGMECCLEQ